MVKFQNITNFSILNISNLLKNNKIQSWTEQGFWNHRGKLAFDPPTFLKVLGWRPTTFWLSSDRLDHTEINYTKLWPNTHEQRESQTHWKNQSEAPFQLGGAFRPALDGADLSNFSVVWFWHATPQEFRQHQTANSRGNSTSEHIFAVLSAHLLL